MIKYLFRRLIVVCSDDELKLLLSFMKDNNIAWSIND
jgi:hypothetical protein